MKGVSTGCPGVGAATATGAMVTPPPGAIRIAAKTAIATRPLIKETATQPRPDDITPRIGQRYVLHPGARLALARLLVGRALGRDVSFDGRRVRRASVGGGRMAGRPVRQLCNTGVHTKPEHDCHY